MEAIVITIQAPCLGIYLSRLYGRKQVLFTEIITALNTLNAPIFQLGKVLVTKASIIKSYNILFTKKKSTLKTNIYNKINMQSDGAVKTSLANLLQSQAVD
jgi:hypothetical protein